MGQNIDVGVLSAWPIRAVISALPCLKREWTAERTMSSSWASTRRGNPACPRPGYRTRCPVRMRKCLYFF